MWKSQWIDPETYQDAGFVADGRVSMCSFILFQICLTLCSSMSPLRSELLHIEIASCNYPQYLCGRFESDSLLVLLDETRYRKALGRSALWAGVLRVIRSLWNCSLGKYLFMHCYGFVDSCYSVEWLPSLAGGGGCYLMSTRKNQLKRTVLIRN